MERVSARRRKVGIVILLAVIAAAGLIVAGALIRGRLARAPNPRVVIETSMGDMTVVLRADKAPRTVASFLQYVREGFYDGLIFHRVIDGFMIQGGGMDETMAPRPTHEPIANEAADGPPNRTGTLAMARTADPNSATGQFFINLVDNDFLNFRDPTPQGIGYCAFGEVTDGVDVVEAIGRVKTGRKGRYDDVPLEPVHIQRVTRA